MKPPARPRRLVAALSGLAAACLALTGCTGSGSSTGSTQTKGVTLTVSFSFPPPPKASLAKFTKDTGIKVNWTNVDWDSLQTKISAAAQAKTFFADVTDVDWSRVGQLAKLGWFHPMNQYLDTAQMGTDMPQLNEFTYKKDVVGIPFDSSFMVTTVNTKLFHKAGVTTMPTTIDQYTADLKQLKSKGVLEYPLNIGFDASEETSTSWYEVTGAFGGTILDGKGHPQFASPGSAGYKAAEWMVQQLKGGLIPPGNINVKNSVSQETLMAKGTVASTFADYSGNVGSLYDIPSSSTVPHQIQYIPTPGVNGAGPNLGNPDGIGIPVEAKYPKAAATFIKWLTSTEQQADFAGANGPAKVMSGYEMPSRISAAKIMATKGALAGGAQLITMLQHSRPVFPAGAPSWYPQFSSAVNVNLHAAAVGTESVAAAISAMAATANRLAQAGS